MSWRDAIESDFPGLTVGVIGTTRWSTEIRFDILPNSSVL